MNNQLSNISTQYRKFSKGQYIEHTQFNEFLDFFEDQDRLSRVMLQGVGIVCGLKPNLIYTNRLLSGIQLSQGIAVTTDGDLLTLHNTSEVSKDLYVSDLKTVNIEDKNYTHFKIYDNFKVKYPAFHENNSTDKQIELWELATAEESTTDFQPINNLINLEDKYLLLYLEDYEKEVKPCRGVDCDNHGIQQIRNLKVLVATKKGITTILGGDHIQPHPLFIEDVLIAEKQERVIVERLILEQGVEKAFNSSDLKALYAAVLEKNNYGELAFDKINKISEIIGGQNVNHAMFKNVLQQCFTQPTGFQYAYDAVKDVMDTYSEIVKLLPKSFTKAFPDLDSFPKHIMLGKLTSVTQLDPFRHQFYNSPVLDDEKSTERVKALISRFALQVKNFRYSAAFEEGAQIKIIPSQKLNPLSNKAVPFYYTVDDEFLKTWNFDKTSNRSSKDNLGHGISFFSPNTSVLDDSLKYDIDKNSFYNIEGHQGMSCQNAFNQIKKIRDDHQLGFDVMILSFKELVGNKDLSKAYFNEYVEKNSGLEHKHGVEKGGTFIMVCNNLETDPVVVADFSLPYICCTPKVKINLSLPSNTICATAGRIPFTVFPFNGIVAANVNEGVKSIGGLYFFEPSSVSKELHGEEIKFTVNGSPTNCSIKVIAQPDVKIVVSSVIYPEAGSTSTTVNFTVSGLNGQNFTDYDYSWDFLDNGSWVTLNPDSKGNISYTFYNFTPKRIPTIRVKVGGSGCSQTIAINNWYEVPATSSVIVNDITFSNNVNCCEGSIPSIQLDLKSPQEFPLSESFTLSGTGSGAPNLLYSWEQTSGSTVTLSGLTKSDLLVTNFIIGLYKFKLTVVDADSGAFITKEVQVSVKG